MCFQLCGDYRLTKAIWGLSQNNFDGCTDNTRVIMEGEHDPLPGHLGAVIRRVPHCGNELGRFQERTGQRFVLLLSCEHMPMRMCPFDCFTQSKRW